MSKLRKSVPTKGNSGFKIHDIMPLFDIVPDNHLVSANKDKEKFVHLFPLLLSAARTNSKFRVKKPEVFERNFENGLNFVLFFVSVSDFVLVSVDSLNKVRSFVANVTVHHWAHASLFELKQDLVLHPQLPVVTHRVDGNRLWFEERVIFVHAWLETSEILFPEVYKEIKLASKSI
jgi:hypothetical protein